MFTPCEEGCAPRVDGFSIRREGGFVEAAMPVQLPNPAGDVGLSFEVGPAFRPEDALRIHEAISGAEPGTAVDIDFRRVRECHAVALDQLARDILAGRARVAVHGMSQHHQRLLGYLGVPSLGA
jgi:hypothetical protein